MRKQKLVVRKVDGLSGFLITSNSVVSALNENVYNSRSQFSKCSLEKQITYTRCDEQAIIQLNLIKGKNWNHEPVQLVYESRPREPTHRSPSPPHRSNLALQQMRRLDSGALSLLYTFKLSNKR